jgi:outer membrane protein OmpA-like peptidoglycan-associated protein
MKYQLSSKFSVSLFAIAISGCSHWPDQGQGGDAQMETSHEYYIEQVDSDTGYEGKGQLATQWSINSLKLDTLVLRGGQECLPGRVREVSMMARRSRRELDGNLLEDARNTLIIFQRELDELERRLLYIKRHTHCDGDNEKMHTVVALTSLQKYQHRKAFLLDLLNDDYSFDIDSDKLTPHYREKLVNAAHYLNQDTSIRLKISGHTDSAGDYQYNQVLGLKRAHKVKDLLVTAGLEGERLILHSFGEQRPIASNSETLGRMKNRRVMVEFIDAQPFYIPAADGLLFEQKSSFFGFSDQDTTKVEQLKHWYKKTDSDAKNPDYGDSDYDVN